MLAAFQKAYKRDAFHENNPCPISLEVIECYMQILLPAFNFNLIMQKNSSTIADVLPNIMILISKLTRMDVSGNYKSLCNYLISAFKHKFKYELNSNVYSVASLLNVSKLNLWIKRSDCAKIRRSAIENLIIVAQNVLNEKETTSDTIQSQTIQSASSSD